VIAFLLALTALAATEDPVMTIHAEGVSEGVGPHARSAAIERALTDAVRQAAASLELAQTAHVGAAALQEPRAYVIGFQTLRVTHEGGETSARVRARIDRAALEDGLVRLAASRLQEPPKVAALIGHRDPDAELRVGADLPGQKAAERMLRDARFDVIPFAELAERHGEEALRRALQEDNEALALIARQHWAQSVVAGQATWEQDQTRALCQTEAEVSLGVVRVWDAEELLSASYSQRMHSADRADGRDGAVAEAVLRAREDVIRGCLLAAVGARTGDDAEVRVTGHEAEAQLEAVIEAILDAPAVYGVEQMAPDEGAAVLRVYYEESMAQLARAVTERDYEGFGVRTTRAVGREMTLAVE
jgi:hypothetical protein